MRHALTVILGVLASTSAEIALARQRAISGTPTSPYQDTLCAIRGLHGHAAEYGVDENRTYAQFDKGTR